MELIFYLITGALAGLCSGLLGLGGGIIVVPLLIEIFSFAQLPHETSMHLAVGTSLAIMALTATSAALSHNRRGAIHWEAFRGLVPGMVIAVLIGTQLVGLMPAELLKRIFAVFLFLVAFLLIRQNESLSLGKLPRFPRLMLMGGFIGSLSGILGIGGGIITVPYLVRRGLPIAQAVGTSSTCTLPIALAGTMGVILAGANEAALPAGSWGYLYLPAVFMVAVASVLTAPLGVHLAHKLSAEHLRRIFGVLLIFVAVRLIIGSATWV